MAQIATEDKQRTDGIDLLHGCKAIAQFVFEKNDFKHQRKIYHLAEKTKFPTFKLGGVLCARRSSIQKFIEDQEGR